MISKRKLIKEALILVLIIGGINFIASYFHWYWSIWWFDMPVHFMGGVFVGMLTIYLFYRKIGILTTKGQSLKALFVILAGTFVFGFMWEIFEFFVQGSTNGNLANIVDSVSDICFDLAGGIFASLMYAQTNAMITNSNETYVQKA
jgi:hypothetical protein